MLRYNLQQATSRM